MMTEDPIVKLPDILKLIGEKELLIYKLRERIAELEQLVQAFSVPPPPPA
jgi:hypothetical protein